MMEIEFIRRWDSEKTEYSNWGGFVQKEIETKLQEKFNLDTGYFLKVPSMPRVKETSSLIEKAFHRGKDYENPYDDITDKVGVRFVVLLSTDIQKINRVVEDSEYWQWSRDRDFEKEREDKPELFDYQSVHYIVTSTPEAALANGTFSAHLPCEVQIRTLMQHAYSELTHDAIYKPKTAATPIAKRYCARAMALIETADECFLGVMKQLEVVNKPIVDAMKMLEQKYKDIVGSEPDCSKFNSFILDEFVDKINDALDGRLDDFLKERPFVIANIKKRAVDDFIYRQPVVLFIYLLAYLEPRQTKIRWPLTEAEIQPILDDLGIASEF
ncbi:hypothetical protein GCM10011332_11980 [Terasakiella brassicae]|uniref:RelA/SpoT domain-containing protein n=1 Tax=Terasakiella brassicae TaxID=1634917 RepID=A0A917FBK3_9PROT|nr:RelA/SpoT domain-containing protein [Terasakiella brassicae]GGF59931.1 hypothetical protein GCM10011332_11980 [Terasakiella brassicae]